MRYVFSALTTACLIGTILFLVQGRGLSTEPPENDKQGPIDVLSDTRGFDIKPYLRQVIETVRGRWFKRIPDAAMPPIRRRGHVAIQFRVMKDGNVADVTYSAKSGDKALDRAAYEAIAVSGPLVPLPKGFVCQDLQLRFNFYYNPGPGDALEKNPNDLVLPCVTSKIQFVGALTVAVSPNSVQMLVGAKQQFRAIVTGTDDSAVTWSVGGAGCKGLSCGVISDDGLYTAPALAPTPAMISVTATARAAPSESASGTVTIVQESESH